MAPRRFQEWQGHNELSGCEKKEGARDIVKVGQVGAEAAHQDSSRQCLRHRKQTTCSPARPSATRPRGPHPSFNGS